MLYLSLLQNYRVQFYGYGDLREMKIAKELWQWTREPADYTIADDYVEIITVPHTDLWQRTYYHFRNDNAPVLQMKTSEKFFSFVVKTEFESKQRFDQCGIDSAGGKMITALNALRMELNIDR